MNVEFDRELKSLAQQVHDLVLRTGDRLVLAESCTAGLIAATLARIPGASFWFCGSFVTYQTAMKAAWIDVPPDHLSDPGVVSDLVAREMAWGALQRTWSATVALSVTGYLGPDAPDDFDGMVYLGLARKQDGGPSAATSFAIRWQGPMDDLFGDKSEYSLRERRQFATARFGLCRLVETLTDGCPE